MAAEMQKSTIRDENNKMKTDQKDREQQKKKE